MQIFISSSVKFVDSLMQLWSNVSVLTIAETLDASDANIYLQYASRSHGDNFPFDGEGGVLAHAFYPDNGLLAGQVHFDDAERWSHRDHNGTSSSQQFSCQRGRSCLPKN